MTFKQSALSFPFLVIKSLHSMYCERRVLIYTVCQTPRSLKRSQEFIPSYTIILQILFLLIILVCQYLTSSSPLKIIFRYHV